MRSAEWSDNGYPADIVERAAALRWRLDRVDEQHRDAVATADSPDVLETGQSVEVKACRPWIENGDDHGTVGRWHICRSSHQQLLEDDGQYALGVYTVVNGRVVVLRLLVITATAVDGWLSDAAGNVVKLPWTAAMRSVPAPGDREGWSR